MTYFIRDDNAPFDAVAELEYAAMKQARKLAVSHGKELGCVFGPESHDTDHPVDYQFSILVNGEREWFTGTEQQIVEHIGTDEQGYLKRSFLAGSQWDFWWD